MKPELSATIKQLVDQALAKHKAGMWPPEAYAKEQALYIYQNDAMYAYYLGVDGSVYEMDLDKFMPPLELMTKAETIKKVYAEAVVKYPELAGLG